MSLLSYFQNYQPKSLPEAFARAAVVSGAIPLPTEKDPMTIPTQDSIINVNNHPSNNLTGTTVGLSYPGIRSGTTVNQGGRS